MGFLRATVPRCTKSENTGRNRNQFLATTGSNGPSRAADHGNTAKPRDSGDSHYLEDQRPAHQRLDIGAPATHLLSSTD